MRRILRSAGVGEAVSETVQLLVSEIVTNAILHARSRVLLTVRVIAKRIRVEVIDNSSQHPVRQRVPDDAAAGRGMAIIDTLASSWGVDDVSSARKRVWFEVAR